MKRFYGGFLTSVVLTGLCITDAALFFLFACGFAATIVGLILGYFVAMVSPQRSPGPTETRNLRIRVLVVLAVSLLIGLVAGFAIGVLQTALVGLIVFLMTIWAGVSAICSLFASTVKRRFLLGIVVGTLPWLFRGPYWAIGSLLLKLSTK